jgi:hypothetical protein
MLETKHQWWADMYAEVHKMGKLPHALPHEDKFPNSQVDRKKPPCSFIGTEQGPSKVAIAGFDTSNVNRERLKSPHALQILAKIDPEISRQGPKILRPTTGPGHNLLVRVGREEEGVSSLRPELAVIARTLQATSVEVDLLYLCDSEAALNKVSQWIGSGPHTTFVGDANTDMDHQVRERESAERCTYIYDQSKSTSRRTS